MVYTHHQGLTTVGPFVAAVPRDCLNPTLRVKQRRNCFSHCMLSKCFQLYVQGANIFKAKVNIEVQWASEPVIAAIERNGGVITTAYYDVHSLWAVINPQKFFNKGKLQ